MVPASNENFEAPLDAFFTSFAFSVKTFYRRCLALAFFAPAMSCVAKRLVGKAHPLSTSSDISSSSRPKRLRNRTCNMSEVKTQTITQTKRFLLGDRIYDFM